MFAPRARGRVGAMSQAQLMMKKPGDLDYGSWRSIAAGTLQNRKSFLEKDTPFNETIDGLLGLMPVGARNVTYLPADAVEALGKDESVDMHSLPGVMSFHHGPYLDDWSKVPEEVATKYNTSPSYVAPK